MPQVLSPPQGVQELWTGRQVQVRTRKHKSEPNPKSDLKPKASPEKAPKLN